VARCPTARRRTGDEAEEAVARHLAAQGWAILARNVRVGRIELDIVAIEAGAVPTLVIVEVRSASVTRFGSPVESVDAAKVERLYRAASALARAACLPDGQPLPPIGWRVDLVAVVRDGDGASWRTTHHLRGLAPP
jgi:Holliday junction resolvase-like predicted endonuclease